MSCNARLALACRLFGSLFKTFAVLCTQQRCARVFGHTSSIAFQTERPVGDGELRVDRQTAPLEIEQQLLPGLRALPDAVGKPNQFLLAFGSGTDDHEQALRIVFEPGLDVDAISPDVDIPLGGQVAFEPTAVFVDPGLLQPSNGRSRQPAGVLAEQRAKRLLEVAGGDALQVEDRDQHLEALRAPGVGRQNARAEPNPLTTAGLPVAHARLAHRYRSDAGHDLALGQMPVTHDTLVARRGLEIGIAPQEVSDFRLDRVREQGTRTVTQNLSQRIAESSWLSQLDDVSVGHGVSLLWWRSGGL